MQASPKHLLDESIHEQMITLNVEGFWLTFSKIEFYTVFFYNKDILGTI